MKKFILILFIFVTSQAMAIYEADNRLDFHEIQDEKLKELSKSVAYQIYFDELKGWTFNKFWLILTSPLSARGICETERFAKHPVMRNDCSGILVGPKKLLLPGNCITEHYCSNGLFYFMFNYRHEDAGILDNMRNRNDFYQCKKILKRVYDPNTAMSYAIIELNKEVKGITPVAIAKENVIDPKDELVAIGHPEGMPIKIANDAYVTDQNETHFLVSSDISGRSKGTAIFNLKTHELVGMLIYGTKNYDFSDGDYCQKAPVLPLSETKELALKVNGRL